MSRCPNFRETGYDKLSRRRCFAVIQYSTMALITVNCPGCQHEMKFSAEKEGKRAKCKKCGETVTITAAIALVDTPPEPEKPPEPPPPPKPKDEFADDGPALYDATIDPELEEIRKRIEAEAAEAAKRKKKDKKKLPKVARKVKAIPDAESWEKVRFGLLFIFFGLGFGLFSHLIKGAYVLLGSVEFSEYAAMIAHNLEHRGGVDDFPEGNGFWELDNLRIYLGMIAGRGFLNYAHGSLILSAVLSLVQLLLFGLGQMLCLAVPNRFGTFGQVVAMMVLTLINFLVVLVFQLLPAVGVMDYVMIPLVTPEIAMTEYNMERMVPIHVLWSGSPFWENFFTFIFFCCRYFHLALVCIFVWSCGLSIKEPPIASGGHGLTQLCLGTLFTLVAFQLISLAGASPVLVRLLRIIYTVWFGFMALYLLRTCLLLMQTRVVLDEKINPKNLAE